MKHCKNKKTIVKPFFYAEKSQSNKLTLNKTNFLLKKFCGWDIVNTILKNHPI